MKFIFGTINSPPVAANHDELELYYQTSVKPFLTQLYKYPEIPITMFYSGPLLDWLSKHHTEYITVLGEMIRRKQVEILGGAFFTPILPLVPHPDRLGQIEDLTTALRKLFGKRPRGCYITKGVWESALVNNLSNSSMEYTFLDEEAFVRAGLSGEGLSRPRLMENHGKLLTIIPQAGQFQKDIFDGSFLGFFKALETRSGIEDGILSLLLSAEDLAGKPFFVSDWGLEKFLPLLRDYFGVWEGVHPGTYLKKMLHSPGRTWFSNTAYQDLHQTNSLPAVAGALPISQNFRHFLSVYPEANLLYAKMVFVHLLAYQIRGDKYKKKGVLEDLWRGQAHQAYFPWEEGGFLESRHRKAAFASLISAELATREKSTFTGSLTNQDFDLDGLKEYLYLGRDFNFFVDAKGAALLELDSFAAGWNYQDVLADHFSDDPRPRTSFADLFFVPGTDPLSATDLGGFRGREFKTVDFDRDLKTVSLSARGEIPIGAERHPLRLKKTYTFHETGLSLDLEVESLSTLDFSIGYANEFYLSLRNGALDDKQLTVHELGWSLDDVHLHQRFDFDWQTTASLARGVYTTADPRLFGVRHYQAHYFIPHWQLDLAPGQIWKQRLVLRLKSR